MSSKSVETRTRILETTVRMLERQGGRGVRMDDIARETGISRQAVYLHFASRMELLIAATRFLDEALDVDSRLAASRTSTSGIERLARFVEFWGSYLPEIYGVAKALLLAKDSDQAAAAAAAWDDRMAAMREGCRAAVEALDANGALAPGWTAGTATDALWTMLQLPSWENLTRECGWSNREYIERMKVMTERVLVSGVLESDASRGG